VLLVCGAACSGNATETPVETGSSAATPATPARGDAAVGSAGAAAAAGSGVGDLEIHVEWHDTPTALRTSPGRAPCGTARPAALAPSTTWGIPEVASATEGPIELALAPHGALDDLASVGSARLIRLPVIGHAVAVADDGVVDSVAWTAGNGDPAWLLRWPHAAGVTDRDGQVTVRGLPAGTHAIVAWLPPRAGAPSRVVRGNAVVVTGQLVEATLSLASP
jgi:hypothetical protein